MSAPPVQTSSSPSTAERLVGRGDVHRRDGSGSVLTLATIAAEDSPDTRALTAVARFAPAKLTYSYGAQRPA